VGLRVGGHYTLDKDLFLICPLKIDESAVYSLPLRFTVSSILFAVLLIISSVSFFNFLEGVKEKEVQNEVSKLTATAEQLSLRGEGSEVALEFTLPEEVSVDFGALPGRLDKWPADANNYCIHSAGKTAFHSSAAYFSKTGLSGPVSFGSGRHRLLLSSKVEPKSGRIFVVISEKGQ
jgi:hypothetical protein